ncbi:hypothetical protein EVA_03409 [gut metagenome]|uniref:Uncharacterized protein n=1 Tax=gut metagenome TaxID=749906 RepID=J9GKX0_9ZZZZ
MAEHRSFIEIEHRNAVGQVVLSIAFDGGEVNFTCHRMNGWIVVVHVGICNVFFDIGHQRCFLLCEEMAVDFGRVVAEINSISFGGKGRRCSPTKIHASFLDSIILHYFIVYCTDFSDFSRRSVEGNPQGVFTRFLDARDGCA